MLDVICIFESFRFSMEGRQMSRTVVSRLVVGRIVCSIVLAALLAGFLTSAAADDFLVGTVGCPMAHCDNQMSDTLNLAAPRKPVGVTWRREVNRGSKGGLGCSSNGTVVACTFVGDGDNLVVYDADGEQLWTSDDLLFEGAVASAPIVAVDGSVIATDGRYLIRFDPQGGIVWMQETAGGLPFSPVLTDSGFIVLATLLGPVSTYDLETGLLIAERWLGRNARTPWSYFHTWNTPAVRGDRVYIVTERNFPNPFNEGRLYAIDVSATGLEEAWVVRFGSSSGGSPLVVDDSVFFDVDRRWAGFNVPVRPKVIAVRDLGGSGTVRWSHKVPSGLRVALSFGRDPRGGVWYFGAGDTYMLRLDEATGQVIEKLDIDALVSEPLPHGPASTMTMAGTETDPVLITSASPIFGFFSILAIELKTHRVLWKVPICFSTFADRCGNVGQFSAVMRGGTPAVVFSTNKIGVFSIGEP